MVHAKCDFIKDINDEKETWHIIARVIRKWNCRRKNPPHKIWSISMVLLDEEGSKVQASVKHKNCLNQFKKEPAEGQVYLFENFEVEDNTCQYRATSLAWKITFHQKTYVRSFEASIPLNAYSFVPIKDIIDTTQPIFGDILIDVMGFLKSFGMLHESRRNGETLHRLTFAISDQLENEVNCVLFCECASNAYCSKQDDAELPIVVVIQLGRLNINGGLPPHKLSLKVGVPIMLVRNIDQASGLSNGTRLRILLLEKHFIKAITLNGSNPGNEVFIHRMDMNPSESKLPFVMQRR